MADVKSPSARSYNMSRIRGTDTQPEVLIRKFLHSQGFRYRLHDKLLPGKPDIVLPKYRTIILVNGCFWHGHEGCMYARMPKTNELFWKKKISGTIDRDKQIQKNLNCTGWNVIVVWECELKRKVDRELRLQELKNQIIRES